MVIAEICFPPLKRWWVRCTILEVFENVHNLCLSNYLCFRFHSVLNKSLEIPLSDSLIFYYFLAIYNTSRFYIITLIWNVYKHIHIFVQTSWMNLYIDVWGGKSILEKWKAKVETMIFFNTDRLVCWCLLQPIFWARSIVREIVWPPWVSF